MRLRAHVEARERVGVETEAGDEKQEPIGGARVRRDEGAEFRRIEGKRVRTRSEREAGPVGNRLCFQAFERGREPGAVKRGDGPGFRRQ